MSTSRVKKRQNIKKDREISKKQYDFFSKGYRISCQMSEMNDYFFELCYTCSRELSVEC